MQTYAQTNLQTADYRLNHKPAPRICEICYEVPAVRRVTHHDRQRDVYVTADVCSYCAGKVGK